MGIRFVKILIVILALNQVFISADTNPLSAFHKVTAKDINLAETNQNFICSVYGKSNVKTGTPIIVYPNEVPTIEFLPCSSSDDFYIMFELRKDDPSAGKLFEYHYSYLGDRQSDGFHKYTGKGFSIAVWSYNHKDAGSYYLRFKVKKKTSDENGWFYIRSDMKITSIPDKSSPTFTVKSFDSEQNDCDWPMFGRIPEGKRVAPDGCGPKTNNLELKWKFKAGDRISSSPSISNSKLYIGSWDKKLYCLNAENGQKVWEYATGYMIFSSPAISNGNVYFSSWDNNIYCLNAENGLKVWEFKTRYGTRSSPTILKGKVYVGSDNLYCLSAENVKKVWEYENSGSNSSPSISNGKVYFMSDDNKLYCLNAENGKKVWEYETSRIHTVSDIYSSPSISNGKVYFGSNDKKLYCLNAEYGKKIWEYEAGNWISSTPAISNGKVYFGSTDDKLYCLNAENGQKVWEYETGGMSSPAISNGKLYFGSEDKRLYCLNAENGKKVWEYETGEYITSSPSISNGKVYVGSNDGYLYCFGDADDKPMSVSPTSISFGTVDRGKTSIKEVQLTFNTNEVIKGTITSDKRWFSVTPATFDSRKSPITISCMIEASKLPGKSGPQTAKVQIKMDSGQTREIDVPIVVETQETIDLELWIGKKYGMIGTFKADLDSPPFIRGGRTLVPVRFISESFGCSLQWEASQKMITIRRFDEVVLLWIGRNYVTVNGRRVDIDTPPVNENGRTYVPIRVISEAFNAMIVWDDTERKLECSYKPPDDGY